MTRAFWLGLVSGTLLMAAIFSASEGWVLYPVIVGVVGAITALLGFYEN